MPEALTSAPAPTAVATSTSTPRTETVPEAADLYAGLALKRYHLVYAWNGHSFVATAATESAMKEVAPEVSEGNTE
jgi:hypothetical protein